MTITLVEAIVDAWRQNHPQSYEQMRTLVARVLAEHETALEKRIKAMNTETAESLALAGKLLMERDDQLHAAEAQCAQLEKELREIKERQEDLRYITNTSEKE